MSAQPANRRSPKPPARRLPPARVLQKVPSCHIMVTWEPTGEQLSLPELARRHGLRPSLLRDRWNRAARPEVVGEALVRPKVERNQDKVTVDYPPHGRIGFAEIRAIHADMDRSQTFFFARWRRAGCPQVVTAELFSHPDMRRIKDRSVPVPTDPKYMDDSLWSKDVPFADLCHLSNTENTGAGKGAIPDEDWIKMRSSVRCVLAGLFRRIPAAGTGGD